MAQSKGNHSENHSSFFNTTWPRFLLFPCLAIVTYPLFIMGVGGDHWAVQSAWVCFLSYCWFCVGGSFHESVHHTLFKSEAANVWYGRVLGSMIAIPYTAYKESHRRHHAYLNTPADYELWPYCDPQTSLGFRRVFVWIDLLFGIVTAPYIYGRIYFLKDPRISPKVRRTMSLEYLAIAPFWALLLTAIYFVCLKPDGSFGPFQAVWLLPLLISPMINTARKFVEHIGLTSSDPVLGTRTIIPGNLISRVFSYFNFDIAIHGPHHRYPKAKHFELQDKLQAYQDSHPDQTVPIYHSYTSAFIKMIPLLWTFPAAGSGSEQPPQILSVNSSNDNSGDEIDWERAKAS